MASAPVLRLRWSAGPPLGAIFAAIFVAGCAAVGALHLDRLPLSFCMFKQLTGLPCPTCGTTRVFGRFFALDLSGAFTMNPLATLAALGLIAWGAADFFAMLRGRSLAFSASPRLAAALRAGLVVAVVVNWAYLVAAGR
jgi:Protein of unknown function (DUF2752)